MKLTLCYPAYRSQVNIGHLFQLANLLEAAGGKHKVSLAAVDTCFLDLARNNLLYAAIEDGSDWALFMDADTYAPDVVPLAEMLNEGTTSQAAVIAAPVQLRWQESGPCWNAQVGEHHLTPDEFRGRVQPVDRIGTAMMAVNCNWLRVYWPVSPWFESKLVPHPSGRPVKMSEDYEFCDGVRTRGGVVLCDGRLEPIHAGITSEVQMFGALRMAGIGVTNVSHG